jgi:hypothetical protein
VTDYGPPPGPPVPGPPVPVPSPPGVPPGSPIPLSSSGGMNRTASPTLLGKAPSLILRPRPSLAKTKPASPAGVGLPRPSDWAGTVAPSTRADARASPPDGGTPASARRPVFPPSLASDTGASGASAEFPMLTAASSSAEVVVPPEVPPVPKAVAVESETSDVPPDATIVPPIPEWPPVATTVPRTPPPPVPIAESSSVRIPHAGPASNTTTRIGRAFVNTRVGICIEQLDTGARRPIAFRCRSSSPNRSRGATRYCNENVAIPTGRRHP